MKNKRTKEGQSSMDAKLSDFEKDPKSECGIVRYVFGDINNI
jgi:hypothetical protein